jgi:sterol desaturase/sphingolipid hydroxylase (fatty acid hydroxylase superfamily)
LDSAALTQDAYSAPEAPETVAPALEPAAPPVEERPSWSLKGLLSLLAFFGLLAAGGWYAFHDPGYQESMRKTFSEASGTMYRTLVTEIILNPWFYGVFGLVLLLERLIPAKEGQGSLSKGGRHDLLWVVAKLAVYAWALPLYIIFLRFLYNQHLSFLTIQGVVHWPWAARLALAFLVNDFLFYVSHVVRHKVGFLWYFHAVHHSQRELNFFTEYRVHPLDDVFIYTIGFIPLFMVESSFVMVMAAVWLGHWHTRLYHSNIRSNFGPLRYVLVTPQSHRVHHSIEPRHHDRNFGLTFSIWDQMFGTQYRGYDEYPDTGIDDGDFPFEQNPGRLGYLGLLFGQFFYPFRAILRG